MRVELLEVLQEGDTGVWLVFTNDLTQRKKDLLAVVRNQDSECGHVVNGKRLRNGRRQRLGEERDATLGLTLSREELGLEGVIFLRDEERRGAESALALLLRRNLVVQQLLDVVDSQEMLTVHGDDDGVPNLGDQNLRLVLDLHVCRGQDLGVDTLWQTGEDVPPRSPDGDTEVEGSSDGEQQCWK